MNTTFRITLTKSDWDANIGGWKFPPLQIPGSAVASVFSGGKEINKGKYEARPDLPALLWTSNKVPDEIAVTVALTKPLSTEDLTQSWKKAAIILPCITTILSFALGIMIPKLLGLWNPTVHDEKAEVIQRFYEDLNSRRYDDAWALIHQARKAEIQKSIKDANDFKMRYFSTVTHSNIKITLDQNDAVQPTYIVAFDAQDNVLRSALYQMKEERVDEAVMRGIIDKKKLVDLVFANLQEYFALSDDDRAKVESSIGKRRLSSLFSPVFVEEFAEELGLEQKRLGTAPLTDSVWRHFILRLTLMKEDDDWKIRSGLGSSLVAEYGMGAVVPLK
jgi:hypothetical protein